MLTGGLSEREEGCAGERRGSSSVTVPAGDGIDDLLDCELAARMNGSAYSQERSEDRQLEHIGCFSSHCTSQILMLQVCQANPSNLL